MHSYALALHLITVLVVGTYNYKYVIVATKMYAAGSSCGKGVNIATSMQGWI